MNKKANLSPSHLSTVIMRSHHILKYIDGLPNLKETIRALNNRGFVVLNIKKEELDVCRFLYHDGKVFLKVYQEPLEKYSAWYVEVLSRESIELA